jgi:NitT/TauT family transport system ATP-binding protein
MRSLFDGNGEGHPRMARIDVRDVKKVYSSGTLALSAISLDIASGEFVSIVGPSGCGKSTLLRIMSGLDVASGGTIETIGAERAAMPSATVFQEHAQLFPWMRVGENLAFAFDSLGVPRAEIASRVADQLEAVGLKDFHRAYPHELSGGMKQRAAVARAFAVDAPVLFMDEPFGALDEQTRVGLAAVLERLWERNKKTVVFVTHGIEEAIVLSDRIVVLSQRPGTIREIVTVDLPRPRDPVALRADAKYHAYIARIWELLA